MGPCCWQIMARFICEHRMDNDYIPWFSKDVLTYVYPNFNHGFAEASLKLGRWVIP